MKLFIVVDIGCIECGEPSDIAGIFEHEEDARSLVIDLDAVGWRDGQHNYEYFEIYTTPGITEYGLSVLAEKGGN